MVFLAPELEYDEKRGINLDDEILRICSSYNKGMEQGTEKSLEECAKEGEMQKAKAIVTEITGIKADEL